MFIRHIRCNKINWTTINYFTNEGLMDKPPHILHDIIFFDYEFCVVEAIPKRFCINIEKIILLSVEFKKSYTQ